MKIVINSVKNETEIVKINRSLKNEKMKRHLWSDKYDIANRKWREYCKKNNTQYTNGGWKPGIKRCSTKSQWAWKMENEMAEKGKSPLEKEVKPEVIMKYPRKAVILYDKIWKIAQIYDAEMERFGKFYTVKIIVGKNKIRVNGVKNILEEDTEQKITINDGTITIKDLIEIALETGTDIITITNIEGR